MYLTILDKQTFYVMSFRKTKKNMKASAATFFLSFSFQDHVNHLLQSLAGNFLPTQIV